MQEHRGLLSSHDMEKAVLLLSLPSPTQQIAGSSHLPCFPPNLGSCVCHCSGLCTMLHTGEVTAGTGAGLLRLAPARFERNGGGCLLRRGYLPMERRQMV